MLFLVFNTSHAVAASREGGFVFSSFRLQTANRQLPTALRAAVCAGALGVLLEALQLLLPHRWADWRDVFWSVAGALTGALVALIIACFVDLEA
jgi:VanZ family protein